MLQVLYLVCGEDLLADPCFTTWAEEERRLNSGSSPDGKEDEGLSYFLESVL
jgi:hypothetical protein